MRGYTLEEVDFSVLEGQTIERIDGLEVGSEQIMFHTKEGNEYHMDHYQSCCESVSVEDICGDLDDLIGSPVLMAEDSSSQDSINPELEWDSYTWTFYKLATVKGHVTIRWFGTSNGYYGEEVEFRRKVWENT
jgi:hypothetical protein